MAWYDWINPWRKKGSSQDERFTDGHTSEEKILTGPAGLKIPAFLPWYDDKTGETAEIRRHYRLMLADPDIKSAILGKILAVAALDFRVLPANKTNERDKLVASFVQHALTERLSGGIVDLVWNVAIGGLVDGYSINEKVWCVEDRDPWKFKWVLRKLKPKIVDDDVVPEVNEFGDIVAIRGQRHNADKLYHPKNFVIYRHLPLYGSPVGTSDLRAAYSSWWILDAALKLRARSLETRTIPPLIGTYTGHQNRAPLQAALEKLKSSQWAVVPDSVLISALEIAGRSEDVFANAIRDLRERIWMAVQGAMLQAMTGGAGVIRGSSEIHKDTADLLKWALAEALKSVFNDHETGLIPDLVDRNFTDAPYPKATFGGIDDRELLESVSVDVQLHQIIDLSKEEIYEKYGRQPPKTDEDRIPSLITQQQAQQEAYANQQQQPEMTDEQYLQAIQQQQGQAADSPVQPGRQFAEPVAGVLERLKAKRGSKAAEQVLGAAARLLKGE